jgi:hypothetical protein
MNIKIGDIYGYWEVTNIKIERNENRVSHKNAKYAYCTCLNCGKKNVRIICNSLKMGRSKSCGCNKTHYLKNTGKNNKQFTGFEEIRGSHWSKIKNHANKKQLIFTITIEYAWNLYKRQKGLCRLSGLPIYFDVNSGNTTASLDRINSNLGYIDGNVQWVHKDINQMKWNIPIKDFIKFCKLVHNYQKVNGKIK